MKIHNFWKLQGAGNDFVFINQRPHKNEEDMRNFVQKICRRKKGIGADGLVFVWKESQLWEWCYVNSDGTPADFCGNAARCFVRWAHNKDKQDSYRWTDGKKLFNGRYIDDVNTEVVWAGGDWQLYSRFSHFEETLKRLPDGSYVDFVTVSCGVPHVVIVSHKTIPKKIRMELSPLLRQESSALKNGANVTWHTLEDDFTVTFERGIEDETLACGSGAMATYLALKELKYSKERFSFPGGVLYVTEESNSLLLKR